MFWRKGTFLRVVYHGSYDVSGKKVGGEGYPLKLEAKTSRESLNCSSLGEAGYPFEKYMAASDHGYQHAV
jgi:hypothetical protein